MKKIVPTLTDVSSTPLCIFSLEKESMRIVGMMTSRKESKGSGGLKYCIKYKWGDDGFHFVEDPHPVNLICKDGKNEEMSSCSGFSFSMIPQGYVLTYVRIELSKEKKQTKTLKMNIMAHSKDLYEWKVKTEEKIEGQVDNRKTVLMYDPELDRYVSYRDGLFLRSSLSPRFGYIPKRNVLLATSRASHFDMDEMKLIDGAHVSSGILLSYDASVRRDGEILVQAGVLLLDRRHPQKVLWRSPDPLFQEVFSTHFIPSSGFRSLGMICFKNTVRLYWYNGVDTIFVESIETFGATLPTPTHHIFTRSFKNPIISPRRSETHTWENEAVFNPAAFIDDTGAVHLLYRAMGHDGISRVGYARSGDGIHFDVRSPFPVYEPSRGFGLPVGEAHAGLPVYDLVAHPSGGGWGGAEDPRVVRIGRRLYMTYVAFEGWNSVRIALTSISVNDFLSGKWKWKAPVLISAPDQVNKNWVLFPEKIQGKYAILHSIAPEILVEYVDSLDNFVGTTYIQSQNPKGGREGFWDNWMRGAGPPPLRTKAGWLLFYHAMDKRDPHKYKLGAMILDSHDPTKILYRTAHPILSPDMNYENDGKPGVVYVSGAVIRGEDLYIYYGGGDKVVCVATAPLKEFLEYVKTGSTESYTLKNTHEKL